MIVALKDLSKTTLTQPRNDLIPINKMIALLSDVLIFIVVKAIIIDSIRSGRRTLLPLPLLKWEPVNSIVLEYFALFNFHQVLGKVNNRISRVHWKHHLFLGLIE